MAQLHASDNEMTSLKISGIPQLKSPGSDSNYLDWSLVLRVHLRATKLGYILKPLVLDPTNNQPKVPATWEQDNDNVCSFIIRTIHPTNLRFIRDYDADAYKMWLALKEAHQDSSSGGRMYWLRKLVLTRMSGDDVDEHINEMALSAERLNSLISPEKPLTADDIHFLSSFSSSHVELRQTEYIDPFTLSDSALSQHAHWDNDDCRSLSEGFSSHKIIFDTTLCGDWASSADVFNTNGMCSGSCSEAVKNASNFKDAFWEVASVKLYQ